MKFWPTVVRLGLSTSARHGLTFIFLGTAFNFSISHKTLLFPKHFMSINELFESHQLE